MDKIYLKLPALLQNIAITIYSLVTYKRKYPANLDNGLLNSEYKIVEAQFDKMIKHAVANVPYYNKYFELNDLKPSDVNIKNYKSILPVINKEMLRQNPEDFYSLNNSESVIDLFTSGTTGSPFRVKSFVADRRLNYSFFGAVLEKNGASFFSESATFSGRVLFEGVKRGLYWRRDSFLKTTYFSSYHISEITAPYYLEELERCAPVYIDAYPSAILELARYINNKSTKLKFSPKFIITTAEVLSPFARVQIESAFNCSVIDQYGCTEMAVMAYSECDNKYNFPPLYSLVEFLPSEVEGAQKIIATGLVNRAMPLLRYDTGDLCVGGVENNLHQICQTIIGRDDDIIETPSGKKVGRLDPVFKGVVGVESAQIVQDAIDSLVVYVVISHDAKEDIYSKVLINNIKRRVGDEMSVKIIEVDALELTASGKFKSVVSLI